MTYSETPQRAGLFGVLSPTEPPAAAGEGVGDLCVVTLNTWKCDGDYTARLGLMARGLAGVGADLVLLQECFATMDGWVDTAGSLADATGLHATYHPARRKVRMLGRRPLDSTSGLALLSRWEPLESTALPLPTHPDDGERIAQITLLPTMGRPLIVVNVHLSHLKNGDALRRDQIRTVIEALRGYPPETSILLGGDFNCEPGSFAMRWLADQSGLRLDGSCDPTRPIAPFPTLNPVGISPQTACLDHLFLLSATARPTYDVATVRRLLDRRDRATGLYASDHTGVCVRFRRAS